MAIRSGFGKCNMTDRYLHNGFECRQQLFRRRNMEHHGRLELSEDMMDTADIGRLR